MVSKKANVKNARALKKGRTKTSQRGTYVRPKQKRAVDNILSGKYKSRKAAIKAAGYSESTSNQGVVLAMEGTKLYLQRLQEEAKKIYGVNLEQKTAMVLMEGLDATKSTRNGEHPDYAVRKQYVDRLIDLMGLENRKPTLAGERKNMQVNFFMTDRKDQEAFNAQFKDLLQKVVTKG